jgi:hypothetical protein
MIEIFRTNVVEPQHAEQLVAMLLEHFPDGKINFDLQDCDRILRVDKQGLVPEKVVSLLQRNGYECHVLD